MKLEGAFDGRDFPAYKQTVFTPLLSILLCFLREWLTKKGMSSFISGKARREIETTFGKMLRKIRQRERVLTVNRIHL